MSLVPLLRQYGRLASTEGPPTKDEHTEARSVSRAILGSEEWHRLADYVRKKWLLPADVDADDIAQEMRVGLWKAFYAYRPGDYGFLQFARYRMHSAALRFVQCVRKTKDKDNRAGNFFRCISALAEGEEPQFVDADAWPGPEADSSDSTDERDVLSSRLDGMDDASAVAVLAFAHHESIDRAAESLLFDVQFRADTGLRSVKKTRAFVRDAAERAAGWRGSVERADVSVYGS
jgi:DNA-directed RNA polymerase specialized sigma24 family protein